MGSPRVAFLTVEIAVAVLEDRLLTGETGVECEHIGERVARLLRRVGEPHRPLGDRVVEVSDQLQAYFQRPLWVPAPDLGLYDGRGCAPTMYAGGPMGGDAMHLLPAVREADR